ncbi:MAG: hypothetical protein IPL52_02380 [Flavobacteriales bacterium]|nr:hypothetical protein [Flavobacteriales bacterium]
MSGFEKRLVLFLALLIVALAAFEANAPKPVDWSPSFSRGHNKPYGAQLVYDRLRDLFPAVRTVRDPLYVTGTERIENVSIVDEPVNHVFINRQIGLDDYATGQLLAMVELGDRAFIAAEHFQDALADTLNLLTDRLHWFGEDTSDIRFIGEHRIVEGVFRYARNFPGAYFTSYDTSRTRVLAVDGASHPVLLEMAWGDGRIVLCSAPRAFSNYNLLKDRNAAFMAAAFSLLPPNPVLWDEFYKLGHAESQTFMRFVLREDALRWAWFLALALIVLYMIVFARRQQRAIPVLVAPRNASRELAHTIGRLYWHKGDHADIARKMIAHFKEEMRARTYMQRFGYDEPTIAHLATKAGRDKQEIAGRLYKIQRAEQQPYLTEGDLLELSNQLHEFRQLIR